MKELPFNCCFTSRNTRSFYQYLKDAVILAQLIRTGDEKAIGQMVLRNLRHIISVAKNHVNCGLDIPSPVSAGNNRLITAARRFDETLGYKFCNYAI